MRWTVHGERTLYDSPWVRLTLADVELPDGERFEHHVVRIPSGAAAAVVRDPERGVLMLWRHRFITDTWGWEVPGGGIAEGEKPKEAAARETLEETGWRPGPLRPLGSFYPMNGRVDQRFYVFVADGAEYEGEPRDTAEAERIDWVPVPRLLELIQAGEVSDGFTLTSVLWALAVNELR